MNFVRAGQGQENLVHAGQISGHLVAVLVVIDRNNNKINSTLFVKVDVIPCQ